MPRTPNFERLQPAGEGVRASRSVQWIRELIHPQCIDLQEWTRRPNRIAEDEETGFPRCISSACYRVVHCSLYPKLQLRLYRVLNFA